MVRGRRARPAAPTGSSSATSRNLLEEYCASPKRKDYKLDPLSIHHAHENGTEKMPGIETKFKTQMVLRPSSKRNVRNIEITRYFPVQTTQRADVRANGAFETIQLVDDDTCDSFPDRSTMTQEPEVEEESNIFLQKPVLKLNVDKSPNQASSIVIKKSLEVKSDFASLTSNGFVSFNAVTPTKVKENGISADVLKPVSPVLLACSDSNSCDSGVVSDRSHDTTPGARLRHHKKPTTPHRIVCPSPKKSDAENVIDVENNSAEVREDGQRREPAEVVTEAPDCQETVAVPRDVFSAPPAGARTKSGGTTKKLTNGTAQKSIKEFYKVRRSARKTKKEVQKEEQRAIEQAVAEGRERGLAVKLFKEKGRGVIATQAFGKGDFVVEYIGDLISNCEAGKREQIYAEDHNAGCYMYYFKHKNVQYCIDATKETGKMGRLVNHSRNGNLMTKIVDYKGRPHLVLLAKEDIEPGKELTYDYGDRSKESLLHHPWLAF
ncbi:histone-lysine N-methyltransferase PR-Set7 [Phlebotomus argentipes]|uniref:histone-lysine N-methyltransferase PR-Set7 n=1 Tax=Phlebotomus argentipes TaxID=94469 RepID=UPI00289343AA|nr:histone-lysine N-methyltransferase PR-Set7 [Phlebotomus argentipes]